jgi:hypothetical protein
LAAVDDDVDDDFGGAACSDRESWKGFKRSPLCRSLSLPTNANHAIRAIRVLYRHAWEATSTAYKNSIID